MTDTLPETSPSASTDPSEDVYDRYALARANYEASLAAWRIDRDTRVAAWRAEKTAVQHENASLLRRWEAERDATLERAKTWRPIDGTPFPQTPARPRLKTLPPAPDIPPRPIPPVPPPKRPPGRPRGTPGRRTIIDDKRQIPFALSDDAVEKLNREADALGVSRQALLEQIVLNRTRVVALPVELVAEIDAVRGDMSRGEAVASVIREALDVLSRAAR